MNRWHLCFQVIQTNQCYTHSCKNSLEQSSKEQGVTPVNIHLIVSGVAEPHGHLDWASDAYKKYLEIPMSTKLMVPFKMTEIIKKM